MRKSTKPQWLPRRMFLTSAIAAASLAGCKAPADRPLRATDTHPADYPTVRAVDYMGKLLEQRTDGRMRIKIYAGGQLGSERDTIEITSFGGLDLNRVNLAPLNAIEPMTLVPSLPFLFRSVDHMRKTVDGPVGDAILQSLEPHGLVGLCFYDSGARSFYNTRHPINTPDDMRGMKIRVQNSDLYVAMIRALGADATPMPLGEVYQSLSQGVVDGAENNWPSYHSGRHFEVAGNYSLSRHVMAPEILVISKAKWRSMSAYDRDLMRQAARESVPFMRQLWDERVTQAQETLRSSGVAVNEIKDLSRFAERMAPVWEQFITTTKQQDLVDQILSMKEAKL